ncbi:branched-chain amino acid ABC transporter permease [Nocardioides alcanivorans]|uniref:branched-chain amino acid ABC transporter permease n=1 Tax=Nocardioides alcanivorans TaxID=2897352 RepID=UPI001F3086E0|nr:branched-chain amino acid ABC transporter permease [Nocardioides alcanivorans]
MLSLIALLSMVGGGTSAHAAEEALTGSVTDTNGAAVAEVPVVVTSVDGEFTAEAVTDTQGIFTVQTPGPGDYVATVDPDNVPPGVKVPDAAAEGVRITLPSDDIMAIRLRLVESVRGTLLDQEGDDKAPVEGVSIVVEATDGSFTETAVSDAEGKWAVFLPGRGEYRVYVDEESLPDGVFVRSGYKSDFTVTIDNGNQRTLLFPMGEDNRQVLSTADKAMQLTVEGIRFGLLLALASLGLSLIFGTTGLVNFAHGEMIALGAIVAWALNTNGVPFIAAALIAVLVSALAGGAQEIGLWRPLRRRKTGLIAMMIITIGMSIFARFTFQFLIGGDNKTYSDYVVQDGFSIGPISLAPRDVWSMAIALIILVGAGLFVLHSRTGKAMRAVSDNPSLAAASGIDVNRVILFVWVLGGALAGLAGVLLGLSQQVKFEMGFDLLLLIFAGVILGGLGTAFGALAGSLVVGLFVTVSTLWIPPELKNVAALAVLILILLFRPQGILGRAERVG